MVYSDNVTFPRSTEVIRDHWPLMTSYVIFRVFVSPRVRCADFEFGIRLPNGVIGVIKYLKEKYNFYDFGIRIFMIIYGLFMIVCGIIFLDHPEPIKLI